MYIWHLDDSAQRAPVIVVTILAFLAGITVAGRIWARRLQRLPLAANDWVMLVALLFLGATYACEILIILLGGVGHHQNDVARINPQSLVSFGILIFTLQLVWPVVQGLAKVSICLLYLALFPGARFRTATIIVMCVCVMFSATMIIITIFICMPVSAQWDPKTNAACGDRVSLWLWGGILNVATDAMVIYLPMPMVWKLLIPRGKKLMLTGLFGVGIIVTVVSIVRLRYVLQVDFVNDTTYSATNAAVWSMVESTVGIIAGCLPIIGPALRSLLPQRIAKRWTYSRSLPHNDANARRSGYFSPSPAGDEHMSHEARTARTTGEWFGYPCTTRTPTPHPIAMLGKSDAQIYETEKVPAVVPTGSEDDMIDSMERGEGIMMKVEWEVASGARNSWAVVESEPAVSAPIAAETVDQGSSGFA